MNGVVTKLGFSIWAKNMSEKAFNSLHRDLIKTQVLSNRASGSFRTFMRDMNRETRAARGFGTVMMMAILGPLGAAAGVFAGAAAGIAAVGGAMVGLIAGGVMAVNQLDAVRGGAEKLQDQFKRLRDLTMEEIAPSFVSAFLAVGEAMEKLQPLVRDLFLQMAPHAAPLIRSVSELAQQVIPVLGDALDRIAPSLPVFVEAFSGITDVVKGFGQSVAALAPTAIPIVEDLLEVVAGIVGPRFLGQLGPLLDGLGGFFDAAKPGFFEFLGSFATALNNLGPVLPALGDFLGRVLAAAGPVLVTLSESLADKLPGILDGVAGFAEFLGTILDNKAVTDVLVDIGMAYLLISGALKAVNAAMAVSTLLTIGTVPGGGPASKAKGSKPIIPGIGEPKAPKPPGKLSAGWNRYATKLGTLLSGAVKKAFIAGLGLWIADELAQNLTGENLGEQFKKVRERFNEHFKKNGFFGAMGDAIWQELKPPDKVINWFKNLSKNISGTMDNVVQWFENIGKNLDEAWTDMQSWLSRAGENFKTWLMNLGKNISGAADNFTQFFENIGRNIGRTFSNIGRWFHNLWTNLSRGVNNVKQFFANMGTNIARTWKNLRVAIHNAWVWILSNVIYRIRDFFTKTIPSAATVLRVRVIEAWNRLKSGVAAAKNWLHDKVITPIKNFFTKTIPNAADSMAKKVRNAFNKAKDWVAQVWTKLGNVVKAPVNWVITNVYNNGIRALWNKVAKAVGASELGKMSVIGGAPKADGRTAAEKTRDLLNAKGMWAGGPVFGGPPGIDTVPAYLNNGEHVLTTEEVQRAGGHNSILKLRSALMGGKPVQGGNMTGMFEGGGFWGKALSIPGKLFNSDFVRGAIGGVAEPVLGLLEKGIDGMADKPAFSGMLKKLALKPVDWLRDWISKDDAKHSALTDSGGGLYKSMFNWIKARVPGAALRSGLRQGDPGYHGSGKAVDLGFSDRSEYGPGMRGMAAKAFNLIKKTFKPNIAELIWDFAGSKAVWNGNDHFFTGPSAGPGTHADHIHWAMARAASGIQPLGGTASGYVGGGANAWRGVVNGVLNELGLSRDAHLNNVLRAIQKESGGNPRAINNWDSNAAAGIPSKGLLQTIDPTFNAWAGKYRSRGVYDPYANVYAAVRYARNRYGAGWSARMAQPGGYGSGTLSADPGWHWVGENGRELVNFAGGERVLSNAQSESAVGGEVHFHIHGDVNDARIFEDKVVNAIHNASRFGRIKK